PPAATLAIDERGHLRRRVLDLDRDAGEEIPLADELNFVRSYLDLERLRLGDRLTVHEEIDVATLGVPVPPLTLQPLVENAIRHGVAPGAEGGTLRLSAQREGRDLVLRVCDDGRGATPDEVDTAPGIGIKAVRGRLESHYPSRGRLDVVTAPGAGFEATVRIPVSASAGVIA
ncbi:MAG: sensor histidine kinase, partial [Gemmatimonadota bacterium]